MSHRDFDAFVREQRKEPITFAVGGETFRCIPVLPLNLIDLLVREAMDDTQPALLGIKPFFEAVVVEEDHPKLKESMAGLIGVRIWQDILDWLVEEYTGRPTEQRLSSEDGSLPTGDSSNLASIARN